MIVFSYAIIKNSASFFFLARSTVSVQDILAVDSWPKDGVSCCSHTEKHTSFKISYASKKKKNKWKCEDIIFQNSDQNLVSRWISTLNSFIEG